MVQQTRPHPGTPSKEPIFRVEGLIQREQPDSRPDAPPLAAYVFDKAGVLLGESPLDAKGGYSVAVGLHKPADVDLLVGPAGMAQQVRESSAFRRSIGADAWQSGDGRYLARVDATLPVRVWWPWVPERICISGHVRKVVAEEGGTHYCAVPFVKVEIFDVDREACFWPPLRRWWEHLIDRPVLRIPDLLGNPPLPPRPIPVPVPGPLPGPVPDPWFDAPIRLDNALDAIAVSPQPSPPRPVGLPGAALPVALNPRPEPPLPAAPALAGLRVGEAARIDPAIAARLDRLTLTSLVPPWQLLPRCFYSRALVCETVTDCHGHFNCCFDWWPFHFRRGRLRFDARPDIIIRLTQTINGVPTVIYMDPYTSTRWDSGTAHVDLFLDNEEVLCSAGPCREPAAGSPVFFTRIGNDEVFRIDQGTGLYGQGSFSRVAYGSTLRVHAQFGDALATGAPARYYRLSCARQGDSNFAPLSRPLSDVRVDKTSLQSESHVLGPKTVNGQPALYEVRNFSDYYWYNPSWIGNWESHATEPDSGTYVLRLELFDENGTKLGTAEGVDYRDGTVPPPAVLPQMTDRCDLVITLDNTPPKVHLGIPAVTNECGVIPWSAGLSLNFQVEASQAHDRLRGWVLYYTKGVNPTRHVLASASSFNGLPGSVNLTVAGGSAQPAPGSGMLANLDSTCAFALRLWADAHIRNGYGFIYHDDEMKAIAIEKCRA